jgi:class 3 adenylate cyclase
MSRFEGAIEHFDGDGFLATFNTRRDQRDHALRPNRTGLALQEALAAATRGHPGGPRPRVGIDMGKAIARDEDRRASQGDGNHRSREQLDPRRRQGIEDRAA